MKKVILLTFIGCLILSIPTEAKQGVIRYQIIYDSKEFQHVSIKQEIVETAMHYFENLDYESANQLLLHDLTLFEAENREVSYSNAELKIRLGDGQGIMIRGDFAKNSFCVEEVRPVSLLRQWFNF